jgi:hypothetical protein
VLLPCVLCSSDANGFGILISSSPLPSFSAIALPLDQRVEYPISFPTVHDDASLSSHGSSQRARLMRYRQTMYFNSLSILQPVIRPSRLPRDSKCRSVPGSNELSILTSYSFPESHDDAFLPSRGFVLRDINEFKYLNLFPSCNRDDASIPSRGSSLCARLARCKWIIYFTSLSLLQPMIHPSRFPRGPFQPR